MRLVLSLIFITICSFCIAQKSVPSTFQIGQYETEYQSIMGSHMDPLIKVCNDNLDSAYGEWNHMLEAMVNFSDMIDFNLDGTRFIFHAFWSNKGDLEYLAYRLKSNSKFIKPVEVEAFLKSFIRNYDHKIASTTAFNHYGTADFPLEFERKQ